MKRTLLIISVLFVLLTTFAACATQHKCPAYGHYTEVPQVMNDNVAEK